MWQNLKILDKSKEKYKLSIEVMTISVAKAKNACYLKDFCQFV
jgi:hypothetical protein